MKLIKHYTKLNNRNKRSIKNLLYYFYLFFYFFHCYDLCLFHALHQLINVDKMFSEYHLQMSTINYCFRRPRRLLNSFPMGHG